MNVTAGIDEKFDIIEKNEKTFAIRLGSRVIYKPKLSTWMVLIPVIFVYYFFQLNKYKQGRSDFTDNYLISRMRALDAARGAVVKEKTPDLEKLVQLAKLPHQTLDAYRELLVVLIQHYTDLLCAEGNDIAELVRSVYRTRTNFLLFCNRLNQVERELNAALRPHMKDNIEGFDDAVRRIENFSVDLRREDAEKFFTWKVPESGAIDKRL